MTKLESPLRRIIESRGQEIIVELVPEDGAIGAHIKLRLKGRQKAYHSFYIEPPKENA